MLPDDEPFAADDEDPEAAPDDDPEAPDEDAPAEPPDEPPTGLPDDVPAPAPASPFPAGAEDDPLPQPCARAAMHAVARTMLPPQRILFLAALILFSDVRMVTPHRWHGISLNPWESQGSVAFGSRSQFLGERLDLVVHA